MQTSLPLSYGRVSQCPLKWLVYGNDFSNRFHSLVLNAVSEMDNNVILCENRVTGAVVDTAYQHVKCDTSNAKETVDTIRYQDPNVILYYGETDSTIKNDLLAVFNVAKAMTTICNPLAPQDDNDNDDEEASDDDGYSEERCRVRKTLIYVTTTAGLHGIPGRAMHSAAQFAIEGLLESLYMELEPLGHRVVLFDIGSHQPTTGDQLSAQLLSSLPRLKSPNVPMRLAPGAAAMASVNAKLRWVAEEIEDWKFLYEH